jgi:hypothetical protein
MSPSFGFPPRRGATGSKGGGKETSHVNNRRPVSRSRDHFEVRRKKSLELTFLLPFIL